MQTKLRWLPVLMSAAIVGGCGDSGESPAMIGGDATARDEVEAVIDDLGSSARDSDGARICKQLFTSNLRISVARASGKTCAEEVGDNIFSPETTFEVGDVEIDGNTATATVTDQADRTSHLVLRRESGKWHIARIG